MKYTYIDGELIIMRSIDRLLAKLFFEIRKFPGPIALQTFKLRIPEPNSTAYALFPFFLK